MTKFPTLPPLRLGSLLLPSRVIYSPLAGCSDYPFRKMVRAAGFKGLIYCEMVKMDAMVRNDWRTFRFLDYSPEMHPIGAQLCGSNAKIVGQAARMVEEMGFDVIDLNCGCPVDKVTKDASGSGLLRHPELIGELVAAMKAAVRIPVTIKIRAGWDENSIVAGKVTRIAEQAGAAAVAVHGRTRVQAYKGLAHRPYIKQAKDAAKNIPVLGNGDIFEPESAADMFNVTGCDGILVSRGTMGAPWLGTDIDAAMAGEAVILKTQQDHVAALRQHFEFIKGYQSEKGAVINMRRVGCWYLKGSEEVRDFRRALASVESLQEADRIIHELELALKKE